MIKEDYLLRMIQAILSMIASALLSKKKHKKQEWIEYDCLTRQILGFSTDQLAGMDMQELIDRYEGDPDRMGKIELAAMTMLKISNEMEDDLLQKSKLRQDGVYLLRYVDQSSPTFSLQRSQLLAVLGSGE